MPDDIVINSLLAAISAQPNSVELRLHTAPMLIEAGRDVEAMEHLTKVLELQPTNLEALRLAAGCARRLNDLTRAIAFEQILNAMQMQSAQSMIESAGIDYEPAPAGEPVPHLLGDEPTTALDFERPELTLQDVKGLKEVKERLDMAFLAPLRNPELRKLYGKSLKGGLLLYGPPGCGKTFLARAVAGELGAKFLNLNYTDVVDMYHGESERKLHELFQAARRSTPCVIFIDEVDAIGKKRSLQRHSFASTVINQLLTELDGVQHDSEGLFVIAATNHPWDVDSALRRPGRLDRTLLVLPPDGVARAEIVRASLEERPTEGIDVNWIANQTDGYSGADMAHLVETAAEYALSDSIKSGKVRPIDMSDFKKALKSVRQSTLSWFETSKNHAIFANEGGYYDDLLDYLKSKRMI
jgi:SpoVK/Ycf46/Vps4 family AAA+-type ATPase